MRYLNTIEVIPEVYRNLKAFCQRKKAKGDIFDLLTPSGVNEYLSKLMPGLTAKCFRTHNASVCLQDELSKEAITDKESFTVDMGDNEDRKKYFYDCANRQVAILCNHQKTVSKNYDEQMANADKKLKEKEDQYANLEDELSVALGKRPKNRKRKRKDDGTKPKPKKKRAPEQIKTSMLRVERQIDKMRMNNKLKAENKKIALGTSKINYMDPRISVSWCKKYELPI
eukprot:TRINITY_DN6546_c0_g1_i1.p1 TRINITY_DN6546_c0_g1~~TRINITY_DN6546_c0_g1_i1.p1  ORF type:complete len:261 (+),score=70.65 TRINITY_DN6546_c0_g1_i1:103-783(+)